MYRYKRLELQPRIVIDGQLRVLGVELVQRVDIKLASVTFGQGDQSLKSIRVGVVVVASIGIVIPSGGRDVPFASGMTVQTVLSVERFAISSYYRFRPYMTCSPSEFPSTDTGLRISPVVLTTERERFGREVTSESNGDHPEQSRQF